MEQQEIPGNQKFYFDFKWIIICAIVGFLLIFQVFPILRD